MDCSASSWPKNRSMRLLLPVLGILSIRNLSEPCVMKNTEHHGTICRIPTALPIVFGTIVVDRHRPVRQQPLGFLFLGDGGKHSQQQVQNHVQRLCCDADGLWSIAQLPWQPRALRGKDCYVTNQSQRQWLPTENGYPCCHPLSAYWEIRLLPTNPTRKLACQKQICWDDLSIF